MGYTVKILPEAYKDLLKAKRWYLEKEKKLAEEFKLQINKEIDYIGNNPDNYQKKHRELRQSLVTRFPYAIFYLVEENSKQIIIFGVLHTRRNPEIIRKRI